MKTITIIGAGLGGLTSGALLAKYGYSVTILEQHNIVGGSSTTFKRKGGFTCEVGLHEMDSAYKDENKKKIFETLGVYDNVEFIQVPEFFRLKSGKIDITVPDDKEEALALLSEKYPEEKGALKTYFTLLKDISDELQKVSTASWWQLLLFPRIFKNLSTYRTKSVKEVMDKLFKSEELKLVLNTNVGYYNDTIKDFSFLYHCAAQHSYFNGGGWYIKGGSQKLSDYLASVIKDNGGKVFTKADVLEIRKTGKTAHAVVYKHKREVKEIKSDIVISNLSPQSTYALADIEYEEKKTIASSLNTVYIGFNKNIRSLYGKRAYSTFIFPNIFSIDAYDKVVTGPVEKRAFVFVDYSQIDSGLTSDDKSFGAICTIDHIADWKDLSKEAYKKKKASVVAAYLDVLEKEYPNIREHIAFAELGTAMTMQHYLRTPEGTPYGYAPTSKQFFTPKVATSKELENLYFVGAWVLGGGFSPAISSGALCYGEILKRG